MAKHSELYINILVVYFRFLVLCYIIFRLSVDNHVYTVEAGFQPGNCLAEVVSHPDLDTFHLVITFCQQMTA